VKATKYIEHRKLFHRAIDFTLVFSLRVSHALMARFLCVKTSAVNRLAVSDELQEVEKYI
jgi:hypothetical protein